MYFISIGAQSVCSSNHALGGYSQEKFCGSRLTIQGNLGLADLKANIPVCGMFNGFVSFYHISTSFRLI